MKRIILILCLVFGGCAVPTNMGDYPTRYVAEQQALQTAYTAILVGLQAGKIDKAEAARQLKDVDANLGLAVMLGRTAQAALPNTPAMTEAAKAAATVKESLTDALK